MNQIGKGACLVVRAPQVEQSSGLAASDEWRIERLTKNEQAMQNRRLARVVSTEDHRQWRQAYVAAVLETFEPLELEPFDCHSWRNPNTTLSDRQELTPLRAGTSPAGHPQSPA